MQSLYRHAQRNTDHRHVSDRTVPSKCTKTLARPMSLQRETPTNRQPSDPHPQSCCTVPADSSRSAVRSNRESPPSARRAEVHRTRGNRCSWPGHDHDSAGCRAFSNRCRTFDCAGTRTLSPLDRNWYRSTVPAGCLIHGSTNRSCRRPRQCPAYCTNRSAAVIRCSSVSPISSWKTRKCSVQYSSSAKVVYYVHIIVKIIILMQLCTQRKDMVHWS